MKTRKIEEILSPSSPSGETSEKEAEGNKQNDEPK